MKKIIGQVVVLFLLVAAGAFFYLYQFSNTPSGVGKVTFELTKGMSRSDISTQLEKLGVVKSARTFYWLGRLTGGWDKMKAAEYEFSTPISPRQIFKLFKSGIGIQRSLLVKEGDNIYIIAQAMEQAGLGTYPSNVALFKSQSLINSLGLENEEISSLEGYLLPNTYFYDKREKPENMVRRMAQAFLKSWKPEYDARAQELRLTRKQVITLASVIEKETGAGEERPIISSVFHNRLSKKMRLQSDPTIIYGMWEKYTGNLHRSDLLRKTEYNTYTIPALPVGPISNPHSDAIRAALYPADTDYLFFVSRNNGTHVFSHTYSQHADWVKKLQVDPSAREGKSWRDLNKKEK